MVSTLLPQPRCDLAFCRAARTAGFAGLLTLGLVACGPRESPAHEAPASAPPGAATATAPEAGAGAGPQAKAGAPRAYIAETHDYRFTIPSASLKALWQKHLDACHRLGPGACDVEDARLSADDTGAARSASLSVRVANTQAGTFLAGLDADSPRAHEIGRTDKTTEVIDTDARLANAEQLRTRLQALRDTAGKLADVIELETRIADVQGQIEATRGQREYLRQQTEKTKIDIAYDAADHAFDGGTWRPVREAVGDIGTTLAATLGLLIRAATVLLPLGLLVGGGLWLRRRFGRRRPQVGPPADPGPP